MLGPIEYRVYINGLLGAVHLDFPNIFRIDDRELYSVVDNVGDEISLLAKQKWCLAAASERVFN